MSQTLPDKSASGSSDPATGVFRIEPVAPDPTEPTDRGTLAPVGRFEPVRPHAEGGLGEVLLARDAELGRDIALKRIKPQFADHPAFRGRFLREAEVTARLEHPGVVPVYGLVSDTHGRPHYAMRFIEGRSLADAASELHADKRLPRFAYLSALRPLLTRFVAVCNAIAYAHSRGVIHRDLKPANVMLGSFGETLVVDWGLAKVLGTSEDSPPVPTPTTDGVQTRVGDAIGTPTYMPPEQAAGEHEHMGRASDIYSLGATLYCVLTGSPPVSGATTLDILLKVFEGDLTPARHLDRRVPSALAAVAHRAMSHKPEERYASADELGREVERWLADEPVTAYPDPLLTRSARWARRHKTAVATAVVLLVAALFGLAAWGGLERSHAVALAEEKRQTELQRQEAIANAKQAEEQGELALKTLIEVMGDVQRELRTVPAARGLRVRWMAQALGRIDSVVKKAADNARADHASIWALLEIGDIYLSAGNNAEASKDAKPGRWTERAREVYDRAHALATRAADANPDNVEAKRDVGVALDKLGDVHMALGDLKAAREAFDASFAIHRQIAEDYHDNLNAQRGLTIVLDKRGDICQARGDMKAAREAYLASLAIRRRLVAVDPMNLSAQADLNHSLTLSGTLALTMGDVKTAREQFTELHDIAKRLVEADPTSLTARMALCVTHDRLGGVCMATGDINGARQKYLAAQAILKRLVEEDPNHVKARRDLSVSHDRLGEVFWALGDLPAARDAFSTAISISQRLLEDDPANREAQVDLCTSRSHLGDVLIEMDNVTGARKEYAAVLEVRKRLAKDSDHLEAQRDLSIADNKLGDVHSRLGEVKTARTLYQAGLVIAERLAKADRTNNEARRDLVVSHNKIGDAHLKLGNVRLAREAFTAGNVISRELVAANPEQVLAQTDLVISEYRLGDIALNEGDPIAAHRSITAGVDRLKALLDAGKLRDQPRYSKMLAFLSSEQTLAETAIEATRTLDACLKQPKEVQPRMLAWRIVRLARQKAEPGEIVATAEALRKLSPTDPHTLYTAAVGHALAAGLAEGDSVDEYGEKAVSLLREAIKAGFADVERLAEGGELDSLRDRDDFKRLLAE